MELNKYFNSEVREVLRSEIQLSAYNPRTISEEGKKQLKKSIKRYGVVGGIVVNVQTGNTIVGGHQKVKILDEMNKFPENDYKLRAEFIDVDEKTEKQLNIVLNNPNVGGTWDWDALAKIVPDIDYKEAGLTDADLNMIGVDYLLQTEDEVSMADALSDLMAPITEEREQEKAERQAIREAEKAAEREAKIQHMKDVKQQVKETATQAAQDMDAYLMLSFDSWEAKAAFCERFGFSPYDKFIKGEVFDSMVEIID